MQTICPVCGFELGFEPWRGESSSDEICPSCGIQFGYDDAAGGRVEYRPRIYKTWREEWLRKGMPWDSTGIEPPPPAWDPKGQLERLTEKNAERRIEEGVRTRWPICLDRPFDFGEAQLLSALAATANVPAGVATKAQLFEAVSRALQFPEYFGENWDAFEECIRDLSWLPPGLVVLKHADVPLTGDIPSLKAYLSILQDAVDRWPASSERSLVVGFPAQSRDQIAWLLRLPPPEIQRG